MPFSRLVTSLRIDLAGFKDDLAEAKRFAAAEARLIEQAMRVRPGIGGGGVAGVTGGRLTTIGGGGRTASQEMRENVRDQLAGFAQIRRFRRELSDQEDRDFRTRRQQNSTEFRERQQRRSNDLRALKADISERAREEAKLDTIRRQAETRRAREARQAAQDAARAEGFMTGGARQGVRNFQFERQQRERAQREANAQAARDAAAQRQVQRDAERRNIRQNLLSVAAGRSIRIDRPGGGFGGGFGGGGIPRGGDIDALTAKVRGGLTDALQRASNAAQQLNLLVGVSIFGGIGALVAEGFRLNSQMEKINLTMAATLGITNDVVDSTGKRIEGEQKAQFLLKGTAAIYDQVRKIAANTILNQQELLETVGENLALGQRAGFRLETLGAEETGPLVQAIADISQLAKAVGLPGGQRQLTQEVRALFSGERLQGATVARLLGFTEISEIQKLQSQPGEKPGTTAFVDEFTKRFERARPIIEKFQESAQGVFESLISQGRLFLQIFSESAFNAVTGVGKELRSFLTDERIRSTATELGESFGNLAKAVIEIGKASGPLFNLLGFMVRNAGTLAGLFATFKSLQFLQSLRGIGGIGGGGGVAGFLGGALGTRAAGGFGGGRAGFGPGVVSPGRQAAIGFASAASEFGVRGALARQGGLARGALGSPLGRGGLGAFAPAIGLLGATPATAIALAALTGAGIGTGVNALGNRIVNAGIQPAPQQVNTERAGLVVPLQRVRAQQESARERARQLERRGRVGLQAPGEDRTFFEKVAAAGPASLLDIVNPFKFGRQLAREFTPTPVLTERVNAADLRNRADQRDKEYVEEQKQSKRLNDLRLQRATDRNAQQGIENALFLAQIRRNKEAEIDLTAQLDKIKAVAEIDSARDRADRILAIEEDRVKKLRELSEDEIQETEEAAEQALGNEEKVARLRARRRFVEIKRQFQGRDLTPELVTLRERQSATADLVAQKEILGARINRFSQRAGFAGQLAGVEGRSLDQIRAGVFSDIAGAAEQRRTGVITNQDFDRFVTARKIRGLEDERKKRREVINEGINLTNQFTDTVRRGTDLQRDYELGLLRLKERVRDREKALNKARLSEINAVVDAQKEAREARQDLASAESQQRARTGAFGVFRQPGNLEQVEGVGGSTFTRRGQSLEERTRRALRERLRGEGALQGLTREQREQLVEQRTREFLGGVADTVTGEGGIEGAVGQFQELGIRVSPRDRQALGGIALQSAGTRQAIAERQQLLDRAAQQGGVVAADQRVAEARDQRQRTELEDFRARRDENQERRNIQREFDQGLVQLAQDFSNLAVTSREFLIEAQRASIGLGGLTAALVAATGVKVPSPEALAAQQARQAVAADQKGARTTTVNPPALPTTPGTVTKDAPGAGGGRRSDAGTIILNLPSIQLGADTQETLKTLTIQLERDSRRTPVS